MRWKTTVARGSDSSPTFGHRAYAAALGVSYDEALRIFEIVRGEKCKAGIEWVIDFLAAKRISDEARK